MAPELRAFELPLLWKYLGEAPKSQKEGRLASSIIVRSEAELFGVSYPRFALRLATSTGGFLNTRRLRDFLWNAKPVDATRVAMRDDLAGTHRLAGVDPVPVSPDAPKDYSLVADCLLSPPPWQLEGHFTHIAVKPPLFVAYGECPPIVPLPFTPYVKHIDLGGGICGQSSAFIANVILWDYAKRACGLGEITLYAQAPDAEHVDALEGEVLISEMTQAEIANYFTTVDLRMLEEGPTPMPAAELSEVARQRLRQSLRAYLRSRMPILLPCDQAKLMSPTEAEAKSVYERNLFPTKKPTPAEVGSSIHSDHCCVLVGFERTEDNPRLIFHDPSALPFMEMKLEDLLRCGRDLVWNSRRNGEQAVPDVGATWPVVPRAVELSLNYSRQHNQHAIPQLGLLPLLAILLSFADFLDCPEAEGGLIDRVLDHSEFALLDLQAMAAEPFDVFPDLPRNQPTRDRVTQALSQYARTRRNTLTWSGLRPPRWVWVEYFGEELLLWNAEHAGPPITERGNLDEALLRRLYIAHLRLA